MFYIVFSYCSPLLYKALMLDDDNDDDNDGGDTDEDGENHTVS